MSQNFRILDLLYDPIAIEGQAEILRNKIRKSKNKYEDKLVTYLSHGNMLFGTPLAVFDWLEDKNKFISGASIYTDGKWFWREYLPYFIQTYHFELPEEFVMHVRNNKWKVPKISYEQENLLVAEYHRLRNFGRDT